MDRKKKKSRITSNFETADWARSFSVIHFSAAVTVSNIAAFSTSVTYDEWMWEMRKGSERGRYEDHGKSDRYNRDKATR